MRTNALIGTVAVLTLVALGIAHLRSGGSSVLETSTNERLETSGSAPAPGNRFSDVRQSMTVGEAYREIPHQRTTFDRRAAQMDASDAHYLETLFELTDLAMVERVQRQLWLQSGGKHGSPEENHRKILAYIDSLESPKSLGRVHTLTRAAIDEQHRYLSMWQDSGQTGYFSRAAPLIRSSHSKLIAAYNELMVLYSREGGHNRQAFFDHLCSLDFI